MLSFETVKYNHPGDLNVWFVDIKGNEPAWAVNVQPYISTDLEINRNRLFAADAKR